MKKVFVNLILMLSFLIVDRVKAAQYIWPVSGDNYDETYIEYGYGKRTYNSDVYDEKYNYAPYELDYNKIENHYGVDITGIKGETYEISSVSDGVVVATSADRFFYSGINFKDRNQRKSSKDGGGYGNYVVIQETLTGKCFLYAHLKAGSISLKRGDSVVVGQKIGIMGSSGDSGHMHLHFEVRRNLNSTTISFGGSLVVTTGYNVETEDPTVYIGSAPIVEETPDEPVEITPEPVVEPAKMTNILYNNYKNYKVVDIYFDKEVEVQEKPEIAVIVGDEVQNADYIGISSDNKKITYKISYDKFNIVTSGVMYIDIYGGIIVTREDASLLVSLDGLKKEIGNLSGYKIDDIYESIISKQSGDVNLDGKVNAVDASIVLRLAPLKSVGEELTLEEQNQYDRCDANGDGMVNAQDAATILTYAAKKGAGYDLEPVIKCDVNIDKRVNIDDYSLLTNAINQNMSDLKYDINGDKKVNSNDIVKFLEILKDNGSR